MPTPLQILTGDAPSRPQPREAGRLVLRALEGAGVRAAERDFLSRRAEQAVDDLPDGDDRRLLDLVLRSAVGEPDRARALPDALAIWAGHLEGRGLHDWAAEVMSRAIDVAPDDPEPVLHAARIARKAGDRTRAAELYDRVAELAGPGTRLARMAAIGRALLAPDAERAVGRELRAALREGDAEAAAVAQEARAQLRRAAGRTQAAVRDYLIAGLRYGQPVDLGRAGHEAADLLIASGDPHGARRLLVEVERFGHPSQVERARARLLELAGTLGDDLGRRRWADARPVGLISLSRRPSRSAQDSGIRTRDLDRDLDRLRTVAEVSPQR